MKNKTKPKDKNNKILNNNDKVTWKKEEYFQQLLDGIPDQGIQDDAQHNKQLPEMTQSDK